MIRLRNGEQMMGECDFEGDGWGKKVEGVKANVEEDSATLEVKKLAAEVKELKGMIQELLDQKASNGK